MSRTQQTGAGGYGGISTLNIHDVRSRYAPHMTIVTIVDHINNQVGVKCLDCGVKWTHSRDLVENPMGTCEKSERTNVPDRGGRRLG